MELRPLEAVTPPPPSLETVSIARRSFLRMSRDGDGGVREGVKILSLVAAYPKHQFFDIAIDIHTCDRCGACAAQCPEQRSEEHTSELQSLMRNSYSVF